MTYAEILQKRIQETGSALCVGIDPRLDLHDSIADLADFCERVIGETAEYAAAFKPNIAYFEALGGIDVVLSPAMGGVPVGQQVGLAVHARTIYAERNPESNLLELKRGRRRAPHDFPGCMVAAHGVDRNSHGSATPWLR